MALCGVLYLQKLIVHLYTTVQLHGRAVGEVWGLQTLAHEEATLLGQKILYICVSLYIFLTRGADRTRKGNLCSVSQVSTSR